MSDSSNVAGNFLTLGTGEMVSRVIAFGVTIYLARILGAESYGVIAVAAGVTLYFSKIADFGIEVVGTREIAKFPDSVNHLASAVLSARLTLSVLLTGFTILGAQLFLPEPEKTIMSLYFFSLIPIAASTKWVHLGLENALPIGLSIIIGEVLTMGIVLCLVQSCDKLWGVPFAQISGELCIAFLLIMALRQRNYKLGFCWDMATALPIFVRALPLLSQAILWLFIYNSDLIFLRFFRDRESVGYYAAAYTLICFLANIGFSYGMSLLPALTRLRSGSAGEKTLYQTALAHTYAVSLPISVGGCLFASKIINLGFGDGYTNSILALQILIWCIPFSVIRIVPWAGLIARGYQNILLKTVLYSIIVNIVLNVLLIPRYGIIGAAISTVFTECLTGILLFKYATIHDLPFVSLKRLWRPTVASLLMTVLLIILRPSSLLVGFSCGIAVYSLVLTVLGGIRLRRGQLPVLNI
ncbi:flippase [Candidatus Scalindua japonica]|uniref:flippase n=1 Tax=Candidatus Scalindua japonica TaxID=1284222 RepID=UPI000BDF5C78|nr:flippase [Candidatus Scalindua japonica]